MGFSVKFNWVLQIAITHPLQVGQCYVFEKSGNRVFPLDTPIDLIDGERNAIAKIRIRRFQNETSKTTGEFEVVKIYTDEEKTVLTNYWIENNQLPH